MRKIINYNPKFEYLIVQPEIVIDDDILMFIEFEKFEKLEIEFNKIEMDHMEMQVMCDIEVKVFNELFLEKDIEFLDVLDLDISYPQYV